jgi:hypothetical protein
MAQWADEGRALSGSFRGSDIRNRKAFNGIKYNKMNQKPDSHSCLIIRYDPRDWQLGDGNVKMRAAGNPNWTGNYHFRELQMIGGFDNEDCVIYGFQESFDAQMDRLIQAGEVDETIIEWFNLNGYMDSVNSDDQKAHFHSSERFIGYNTGNGFNGNAVQDPCKAAQTYGVIPWTDWPFDATITPATYFDKPPQTLYDKGLLFLSKIGGKQNIAYHWVNQSNDTPRPLMDSSRQTAPLILGVATTQFWNQLEPTTPAIGTPPNHVVDNTNVVPQGEYIEDHYVPFEKIFTNDYPIPQCFQMVLSVSPVSIPPAPLPPTQPTVPTTLTWLQALSAWLSMVLEHISPQGRQKLGGASRSGKWSALRNEFLKGKVCGICGGTTKLEAHHVIPFSVDPSRELDEENLYPLCEGKKSVNCHLIFGHYGNFAEKYNKDIYTEAPLWNQKITSKTEDELSTVKGIENH